MADRRFRSQDWFADPDRSELVALYLARFMNCGLTSDELCSGRPVIGIAQTGGGPTPCNLIHLETVKRVRDGIRDVGGIPIECPTHASPTWSGRGNSASSRMRHAALQRGVAARTRAAHSARQINRSGI